MTVRHCDRLISNGIQAIWNFAPKHLDVPDNILVQVVSTDDTQKVLKQGQKNGLYAALDIGTVWLKKELGE